MKKADVEQIEKIVTQNTDDLAVALARSLERLENKMESMELRYVSRLAEILGEVKKLTNNK